MQVDLCAEHSLASLARQAGVSRFQFLRAFKKQYGVPPHAYLTSLRLDKGEQLLRASDLSITAIASEVGFGSVSRFSEAFSRRHGSPPSTWRQKHVVAGDRGAAIARATGRR